MKTILVVAAHPDDEVLGCGGTIAKHSMAGDAVHVVFMADGVGSRSNIKSDDLVEREEAMENAGRVLNITSTTSLGFPDNQMDTLATLDVVKPLEDLIARLNPEIIYTHHYGDLNVDHKITNQAVMTACRPQPGSVVREIYAFEVMSSTEWQVEDINPFLPTVFIDISSTIEQKLDAIDAYSFEMREAPHSRSKDHVVTLAKHRGNSVGFEYAEAFKLLRLLK